MSDFTSYGDGKYYGDGIGGNDHDPDEDGGFFNEWRHPHLLNVLGQGYGRTAFKHLTACDGEFISFATTRSVDGHMINLYVRSL